MLRDRVRSLARRLDESARRYPLIAALAPLGLVAIVSLATIGVAPTARYREISAPSTATVPLIGEEVPPRFITPTILVTRVTWDRTAIELAGAAQGRTVWYVVANTQGAGEYLRGRALLTDRRQLLPEGALLAQVSVSIDPTWRHVWVMPDGPSGWIPADFVAEMP